MCLYIDQATWSGGSQTIPANGMTTPFTVSASGMLNEVAAQNIDTSSDFVLRVTVKYVNTAMPDLVQQSPYTFTEVYIYICVYV